MGINFKVNFEQIDGFVNLDKRFKDYIKKKILTNQSLREFSNGINITDMSLGNFLNKDYTFIRIKSLVEILNLLNINIRTAEKFILCYKDASVNKGYNIQFPYNFSPFDMRVIGVLIGDGNLSRNRMLRWIQKDISPLRELLSLRLNYNHKINKDSTQLVIPSFFKKISCFILGLNSNELATFKLIEKSIDLPKEYQLALLLAIIEDEGNINPKNYSGINIRMSNRNIIYALDKLCKSLNYKTSKIIKYKNNLGSLGENNIMYKLNILSEGILKLGYDLLDFEKRFGKGVGLWKKKENFFKRWIITTGEKAKKNKEGRILHEEINNLFKEYNRLSINEISDKLRVGKLRVEWQIKNMYKRGEIRRFRRGVYVSKFLR